MKHRVMTRTFGRRSEPRRALMRGLATALIERERIEVPLARAKELRRVVEPLITLGKRGDLHARRQAAARLYTKESVAKLFGEVAERFRSRPGGYLRILKTGFRRGDGAPLALVELIPTEKAPAKKKVKGEAEAGAQAKGKKDASGPAKKRAPKKKARTSKESEKAS